ncbi:MAG: CrcB family protein, partial [Clostridium sp.]|nr:CrcB family protein [Clostridium sp.]
GGGFPWGTLTVNLAGCFIIGLVSGVFARYSANGSCWHIFLATGLCGGFTTFSTFSNESLGLVQSGNLWGFAGYVAASVILGIFLVAAGYAMTK